MQTTIQKSTAVRLGSVKLEVGESLLSMVNVGALRGVSWVQKGKTDEILFDNTEKIKKFSDGNIFALKANLCEIDWANIQVMNDGQVEIVSNPATLQTVVAEAHGTGWTIGQPIRATYKNGDNTIVGSIVVKQGATTLTLNTDYRTYVSDGTNGVSGYTYIVPLVAYATAITFGYTYTPNASKTITFNASGTKVGKYIRITNTDSNGLTQVFTMSGTSNLSPIEISFASDNEANVSEMPIELEGTMVSIVDEQAV
jgi:hypothetical protein